MKKITDKLKKAAFLALFFLSLPDSFASDWQNSPFMETDKHGRNEYGFITFFYIDEIEREDGELEIEFNSAVHPDSISRKNFIINGEYLPEGTSFKISRKGTKIVIQELPEWRNETISIEVHDLMSVNGTAIEQIPPVFMDDGDEYERDEDLEFVYWYWYDNNGGKPFKR